MDIGVQVEVLEALIHAVEDGRLPFARVEDALKRQRRAKERFLADTGPAASSVHRPREAPLGSVVGCDAHRRIADEMATFL